MALNFVVSYTFSPSTTISSSQVNTNTSDVASVFQGLEAVTKSFARLQVDAAPTVAADVVRKDYVDRYSGWRRPNLQFASATTVTVESGLDGTSGDIGILFPDGTFRTETSTTHTTFNITRNAVLVTSGAQSGLTGATSEANNTSYSLYAVKVTDSSTLWVTVGSTVIPVQANYATLNTAYGTNGWVYLGTIRNGDNSGIAADILGFKQCGHQTVFNNTAAGASLSSSGILMASTAGATSLTYTYAAGTGAAQIPAHLTVVDYSGVIGAGSGTSQASEASNAYQLAAGIGTARFMHRLCDLNAAVGILLSNGSSVAMDIYLSGFTDSVLGVGSNPLL